MSTKGFSVVAMFAILSLGFAGCSKTESGDAKGAADATAKAAHSHEEWWCAEHGVPEEICALCHPKIAADYKAKGDWCKEHDRPDSQCFKCHPELEAKFAKTYEAKYGKMPPKPTEGIEDHEEKKN